MNNILNVYKIEDLPKRIYNGKKCIDWNNCIGKQVCFIYNNNKYILTIISYDNKISRLKVKYNNNESYIYTNPFLKGQIGKVIKKRTIDFKVEIGTIFKDNNRDMIIIDREYKQDKNKNGIPRLLMLLHYPEDSIVYISYAFFLSALF